MKRVTAYEARANWFRLLDEVAAGEVVVVERNGERIVLRRERATGDSRTALPDYSRILQVREPDDADLWHWTWAGPEEGIELLEE